MASASSPTLHVHSSKPELSTAVGAHVASFASEAIAKRGKFVVALSGGSLPGLLAAGLLEALAKMSPEELAAHCAQWEVFFADERIVALDHDDSNYKGCMGNFLSKLPIPPANVHAIDPSLGPEACAADYERQMTQVLGERGIDMALLGMGPDGHTCSLFPGHALLQESGRLVAAITDSPKPPASRVTLTYKALHASGQVCFVAAGGSKADVLPRVLEGELPAGNARPKDGETHWFVDTAAAAKL